MATVNKDIDINSIYTQFNDLHTQMSKNRQDIASLSSKLVLANPQQISNMLIDINNLKHNCDNLEADLKDLQNKLEIFDGRLNQLFLSMSQNKQAIKDLQNKITQENSKFFSLHVARQIAVAVIASVILFVSGTLIKGWWTSFIEEQTHKHNPQIRLTNDDFPAELQQKNHIKNK